MIGGGGGVRVKVAVQLEKGVGVNSKGVVEAEGVNACQVGEAVGIKVRVGVAVEVEVALLFPSARDNEKPPRSKPIEARAMKIPRSICHRFFISGSLQATLPRPAQGH